MTVKMILPDTASASTQARRRVVTFPRKAGEKALFMAAMMNQRTSGSGVISLTFTA
jgi:hypothetical protein